MRIFISHNSGDKETARLLAIKLVECGLDVWFDEWRIRPGDSITGGMEDGISQSEVFVLLWSYRAAASNWVGTELRAALRRQVDHKDFRVIPLMLDQTPLPTLIADYRGFALDKLSDLERIAKEITGEETVVDLAQRLQKRLLELAANEFPEENPIRALVCPRCASKNLAATVQHDPYSYEKIYYVLCNECEWGHAATARVTSAPNKRSAGDGARRR